MASSDLESQSPALLERCNDWHMRPKKCEWKDETVTNEVLESLPDQEEEVVGIITMEDVLEELLQVSDIIIFHAYIICLCVA